MYFVAFFAAINFVLIGGAGCEATAKERGEYQGKFASQTNPTVCRGRFGLISAWPVGIGNRWGRVIVCAGEFGSRGDTKQAAEAGELHVVRGQRLYSRRTATAGDSGLHQVRRGADDADDARAF